MKILIGLIKAANTFNKTKNNTFGTYAAKCIKNEIFRHYKKAKKYTKDISFETIIGENKEGKEIILEDRIENTKSNFVEKILKQEEFIQLVNMILNYLESKKRIVMLYKMGGKNQTEIEKILNSNRSYISRVEKKLLIKYET